MELTLLRHAPTQDHEHIRGQRDVPLSAAGARLVALWPLPWAWHARRWLTSPLQRARHTAKLLGHPEAEIAPALTEMNWGEFAGHRLIDLRRRHPQLMAEQEARGLDFCPPGGESPRAVQKRLSSWLKGDARHGEALVAVTHRGVMRALLALATAWPMLGPPPLRLPAQAALSFDVQADGRPVLRGLLPLPELETRP